MTRKILLILTALLIAGCTPLPAPRIAAPNAAPAARIEISADGKIASTTLDVLTFNLEGLSWPARAGRGPSLEQISQILIELDEQGKAPDVVMAQEMFSKAAIRAVHATRYANIVAGPSRTQKKRMTASEPMPRPYIIGKGEIGLHVLGAGLAILSRYPVTATQSEPFGRRCAGLDCLSNKGMLHARIAIPGVPEAVDLFDTHLNSQTASRVAPERHAAAHQRQVRELAHFIDSISDPDAPTILGGDFNMRHSALRYQRFREAQPFELVHQYCIEKPAACRVDMSWDGDEPWMDTQDLQLFSSGRRVTITPISVSAMFDGSADSPKLSDHDGFRVVYRLSWRVDGAEVGRR